MWFGKLESSVETGRLLGAALSLKIFLNCSILTILWDTGWGQFLPSRQYFRGQEVIYSLDLYLEVRDAAAFEKPR